MAAPVRKNLVRIVFVMCSLLILSFVLVLLNGTVFFSPRTADKTTDTLVLKDLMVGEPELRRVEKHLVWITRLSAVQKENIQLLGSEHIEVDTACNINQQYCLLKADTDRSGVHIQYTVTPPAQLPASTPWHGGFVNPNNGAVYDLLGRAYRFQGTVEPLLVLDLP